MAAVLGGVAADDIAFHPRGLEHVRLLDRGDDAAQEAVLKDADQARVLDRAVAALLVAGVVHRDGLAADLAHEARLLSAVGVIKIDEALAERGFEDAGQDQDRRLHGETREPVGRGQGGHCVPKGRDVAPRGIEADHVAHPHVGVHDHPARRDLVAQHPAIGRRHAPVGVPEDAETGDAVGQPRLALVRGVGGDQEQRRALVVEVGDRADGGDALGHAGRRGRAHKAKDQIPPRGTVEIEGRVAVGPLADKGGGVARMQGDGFRRCLGHRSFRMGDVPHQTAVDAGRCKASGRSVSGNSWHRSGAFGTPVPGLRTVRGRSRCLSGRSVAVTRARFDVNRL